MYCWWRDNRWELSSHPQSWKSEDKKISLLEFWKIKKKLTEVLCAVNPIHFKMKRNKRYSHFQKKYIATKPHYIKDKRDFNAKTMVPGRCRRSE